MLIVVPESTPFLFFFLIAALCGFGFGTAITATAVASQTVVSKENIGVATSFNSLVKYLGQTMMVSIFGIVFNMYVAKGLDGQPNLTQAMMNKVVNSADAKKNGPNIVGSITKYFVLCFEGGLLRLNRRDYHRVLR